MVDSIMKILTVVVVVVLVIVLVPAVAPFVTDRLPHFGDTVGNLVGATWDAFKSAVNRIGFSL
jgi:hypothetical protein